MKLSFHGATAGVTGSCYLLETSGGKILVDCGLFQGERVCSHHNFDEFGFEPASIDAVIITHSHADHTGRIPSLIKHGFSGKIYATAPTRTLAEIILEDTQKIMMENSEKCGDDILFTMDDLTKFRQMSVDVGYHEAFEPVPGIKAMLHDAGHILGSSYVTLDDGTTRVAFSGDIGNDDVPILPATEPISHADVIVCESTYGDRDHEPVETRSKKLLEFVSKVTNRGGTLVIPAFSIERTQELLYEIDALIANGTMPRVPIYLDSPLAIKATALYRHYKHFLEFKRPIMSSEDMDFFSFPLLRETLTRDESKTINNDRDAKVIIAGSGMMTGGRVMHHLMRYLPDAQSGILVVGFQAHGTLGSKIQSGAKEVKIFGEHVAVRADVETIHEFSAHGDRAKLARWLKPEEGEAKKIFLVHGEPDVKEKFKAYLAERMGSEILIPKLHESFDL